MLKLFQKYFTFLVYSIGEGHVDHSLNMLSLNAVLKYAFNAFNCKKRSYCF